MYNDYVFLKDIFLKEEKFETTFGTKIKWKLLLKAHYTIENINIPPTVKLQHVVIFFYPFYLALLMDFLKVYNCLWTNNYTRIIKKS